jgi:membrane protease YdiL (CAAX protease family)
MPVKKQLYLMGLMTLLIFPIPSFVALYFLEDIKLTTFLAFEDFKIQNIAFGGLTGISYAIFVYYITRHPIFRKIPLNVEELIRKSGINLPDAIFLSFCAGLGEELLFRSGVQHYLGIILTSIIFVAVHGYFSLNPPLKSLYGLLVLPFILILGFGFNQWGLWFAVSAHFFYDLVLFSFILKEKKLPVDDF